MGPERDTPAFNDDLLANDGDRERARKSYAALMHVLDDPDLQQLFNEYDRPANRAKKRSRRAGLLAIVLGTVALLGASAAPLSENLDVPPETLGLVSAVAGVFSVIIGASGVLYSKSKRRWLRQRLMTERLRQFHFQTFAYRLPEIVASLGDGGEAKQAYRTARKKWFNTFRLKYERHLDTRLTGIIQEEGASDMRLHEPSGGSLVGAGVDVQAVFEAYMVFRIDHQLQYANFKLDDERRLFSASPQWQLGILSQTSFVCVLGLFAIHLVIAVALVFGVFGAFVHSPLAHVAAIWCAVAALAVRAVEEGLGVRDEVERYRDYRSAVAAIRESFVRAETPEEKLRVIEEMERLTFEEMCSFLRSANATRFVM